MWYLLAKVMFSKTASQCYSRWMKCLRHQDIVTSYVFETWLKWSDAKFAKRAKELMGNPENFLEWEDKLVRTLAKEIDW